MCAVHIIPHSQGYSDVAYTLGDEANVAKGAAHNLELQKRLNYV